MGLEKARVGFAIQPARTALLLWLGLAATSCGTHESPHVAYRAAFDKSMTPDVEQYLREVATRWDMVIHEQSKSVTGGDDVFTVFMYCNDRSYERNRWTVIVRNHDFGTDEDPGRSILSLTFFDKGDMSTEALDRLASEMKYAMQDEFGLDLCQLDAAKSVCDASRMLEEAREDRLRNRK